MRLVPVVRIEELADLLGMDDPAVRQLVENAKRFPESRESAEAILLAMCDAAGIDLTAEPAFGSPDELPAQGQVLGTVVRPGRAARAYMHPVSELSGHTGIFGTTGSGKSSLVGHLCEYWMREALGVIILDVADEYGWLTRLFGPDRLLVLSARRFPLALFGQPPGTHVAAMAWLSRVVGALRECWYLRDGSCNLLLKTVGDMYAERGLLTGSEGSLTVTDVFQALVSRKFSAQSRHAGYLETLVNRFQGLALSFPGMNALRGVPPGEVLGRSLLVRMADLSVGEIEVFSTVFVSWLTAFLEGELRAETTAVLVMEEAHLLASRQKMARFDLGEPLAVRTLRTARKFGLAVVVVDQVPSELPAAVLGNTQSRIVFRLTNYPCIRAVAYSMGLDRDQEAALAGLPRRRAVVQAGSLAKPFLMEVVEIPPRERPSPEELDERERESLVLLDHQMPEGDAQPVIVGPRPGARPAKENSELGGDLHRVLVRICEFPYELITERCEALALERAREFRARQALERLGLVELGDTIGARSQLFVPTSKGREWAERLRLPIHRYKSGIGHESILRRVRQSLGDALPEMRFVSEGEGLGVGSVQPDLVAQVPGTGDGERRTVAIQVACSNKPRYEAAKALELARIPFVDAVVVVARSKAVRDAVVRAVGRLAHPGSGHDESGQGSEEGADRAELDRVSDEGEARKIGVIDIETCLEPGYRWRELVVGEAREGA